MAARRRRRKGRVSFDTLDELGPLSPRDLEGVEVTIRYRDGEGDETMRRVRMLRYYDDRVPTLYAMCLLRQAPRSFLVERIEDVIDADGVTESPSFFLARFGIFPAAPTAPDVEEPLAPAVPAPLRTAPRGAGRAAERLDEDEKGRTFFPTPGGDTANPPPAAPAGRSTSGLAVLGLIAVAAFGGLFLITGGLKALFGFLSLMALALLPLGLIWPGLLGAQRRWAALGRAAILLILIVGVGVVLT